jgi:penicillin-binding protein 1A
MSLMARNRRKKRHDLRRVLYACAGGLIGASTLVAAHSYTLVRDSLRAQECDAIKLGQNTRVYDRKGRLLATIAAENNRTPIRIGDMPRFLIDATVAIEDKKFFSHAGIDYKRIAGAAVKDIGGGSSGRQGGSTITMQLMKNLCHPNDRTRSLSNKLVEAYWAKEYETTHSKQLIMQRYLNSVFYGNNAIGVEAASLIYFDRHAAQLTLPQAALLAGLPQAPSQYNPFRNKEDALARRNVVLDQMVKEGYITAERAARTKPAGLSLRRGSAFKFKREGYYVDYVTEQLKKILDPKKVKDGGYKAYTAIDPVLQQAARSAMRRFLTQRWPTDTPSAALVMIEAKTGKILAMASSDVYTAKSQFNLAGPTAGRGAGSTFKVFVLTAAISKGVSPSTQYFSKSPIPIDGTKCHSPAGSAIFHTFGGKGGGMKSLVSATTSSDNSIYVQLTCDLGPELVYQTAKKMGITSLVAAGPTADRYNLSMGLGGLTNGVSVLDMARAYAPLANGGYRVNVMPMTRLVRQNGTVVVFKPKRKKIFSDGVAAEVTKILRQNVLGGTGTKANLPNVPVAGKTGTTTGFKDAWFVGYTPKYVTAVWIGYPLEQRFTGETGGNSAANIWHDFMAIATRGESGQSFPTPTQPAVFSPFSGYYKNQASALAAAEAKKKADAKAKADAAAKAKAKADKKKNKKPTPGAPSAPGAPVTPPPATPPPVTTPPTTTP